MKNNENLSKHIRDNLEFVRLEYPDQHLFVRVNGLIMDTWIRYVDVPSDLAYADEETTRIVQRVYPNNTQEYGFFGPEEEYLALLSALADGCYVRKDTAAFSTDRGEFYPRKKAAHIIIRRDFKVYNENKELYIEVLKIMDPKSKSS